MARTIKVAGCDDCPFLWSNMEYQETLCRADLAFGNATRGYVWGLGEHRRGKPAPSDCPLRADDVSVGMKR